MTLAALLWLSLGLALLVAGGEAVVRGSVAAAKRFGVSPLLIGLTLVGFGTSTPELVTSLTAALQGRPGIAIGNVVGSNIANVLLILGASVALRAIPVAPAAFRRDGLVVALSSLACLAAVLTGTVGRVAGAGLVLALVAYLVWAYLGERATGDAEAQRHEHDAEAAPGAPGLSLPLALVVAIGGIALTIVGARLLVGEAVVIARAFGLSEAVIGLTIVAIGTSLPELVACLAATLKSENEMALGNVVGSNIYNVFGILGITALVHPMPVPPQIAAFDIWVLLGLTAALLVFLRTGWRLAKREGWLLLAGYAAYLWATFAATA